MTTTTARPEKATASLEITLGMRPCFVQLTGTYGKGGAERLAHNLGIGLRRGGFQSIAVALRTAGGFADMRPDGVEVVVLGAELRHPFSIWRTARNLRRLLIDRGVKVLHVHGERSLPFAVLVCRTMGRHRRPRLWFTWHIPDSILSDSWLWNRICVWAMRRCDKVFGVSQAIVDRLNRERGINADLFVNGVPEAPATTGMDDAVPTIVWQARMAPTKDPKALVRAAAQLKEEGLNFRVVMAGSGVGHWEWYEEEVHDLADELGVTDRIEFPGWVDNIDQIIHGSAIGVQTSHYEGLSMSLLEHMMAGLAVVATDVGDTACAIEHGRTGLIVQPGDGEAIAYALRLLLTDHEVRHRLGAAARDQALTHHSLAPMADRIASAFHGQCP